MDGEPASIWSCFRVLRDPRDSNREKDHPLLSIVATALCAAVAGADDWPKVVAFAQERADRLKAFLALPNGVPSRSTFERVFRALSPRGLDLCLGRWLTACVGALGTGHIAIGGKSLRSSGSGAGGVGMLHPASAWATSAHLGLGQVEVDGKSNEITAAPRLLGLLGLKGALVTIDAIGCQKQIASQIVEAGGDYAPGVKDNQPRLASDVLSSFTRAQEVGFAGHGHGRYETEEKGHGRLEKRARTVLHGLERVEARAERAGPTVIGTCHSERTAADKTTDELRLLAGSRRASAKEYAEASRGHRGTENNPHWQLGVTFGEDDRPIEDRNAARNAALLRKWALCLLKRRPGEASIAAKRYKAALSPGLLQEVLQGG